jgi:hypothetical protein
MGSRFGAFVVLAAFGAGCAPIYRHEAVSDEPLQSLVHDDRIADSVEYQATAAVHGELLTLSVEQSETCETITTPQFHRVRSITRNADATITRATWISAAVGLALGGYGYLNADTVAAQSNGAETPDSIREASIGALIVGVAAAVVGVIDAARATDYQHDDGVLGGRARREEHFCERHKTRATDVSVLLGRGEPIVVKLDGTGNADIDLAALPADAVPEAPPLVVVTIGAAHEDIRLSSPSWIELRGALLADPHSRLAMAVLAARHAHCDELVTAARAVTPAAPEGLAVTVGGTWATAKQGCADLWTADMTAEQSSVERRIADTKCAQELDAATSELAAANATNADGLLAELGDVRRECTSQAQIAQITQLDAKLAIFVKQAERAEAEAAKHLAQQQAREARDAQRQQQAAQQRAQNRSSAMLLCNDGTLSPTCTCGRDSYRGCCSHHQGVNSCSADSR